MATNPQWEKLRNTLSDLQNQRDELLAKLTPSHPTVRAIDLSIAEVESQIAEIPMEIREETKNATTVAESTTTDPATKSPAVKPDDKQFHVLAQAEETAQREYQRNLAAEAAAWDRQSQAVTEGIHLLQKGASKPIKPAIISDDAGANVSHAIIFSLIWALIVASMVARRACINEKTYETPAEVRQSLELPVLGMLPVNPHAAREQPRREPRWVKRVVVSSEAWLAGIVVLLAVVSLLDTQFLHDLIADPLSACSKRFW
jgi:capsular polysaccharide biosynthesis protein